MVIKVSKPRPCAGLWRSHPAGFVRPGLQTEGMRSATFRLLIPGSQPSAWKRGLGAGCPGEEGPLTTVLGAEGREEADTVPPTLGGDGGLEVLTVNRQRVETEGQGRGDPGGIQSQGEAEGGNHSIHGSRKGRSALKQKSDGATAWLKRFQRRLLKWNPNFLPAYSLALPFLHPLKHAKLFPTPAPSSPRAFYCLEISLPCTVSSLSALPKCHLLQKAFLDYPKGSS